MAERWEDIIAAMEKDEELTVSDIADVLKKRWPAGFVILALEKRAEDDTTSLTFAWRGSFYASLGMVDALHSHMLESDVDEDLL